MNTAARSKFHFVRHLLAGALALSLPLASRAQTTKQEKTSFTASVTSFQSSVWSNGRRYITATIHFQNKTKLPIILGFNRKTFSASDDQGNHYGITTIRGIGQISDSNVDPKFVLAPESGGDMLIEAVWGASDRDIFGTTFEMSLAVRPLKKLEGNQYQFGPETVLEFTGLKSGYLDVPERAVNAGPFTAEITRSKFGRSGRWNTVEMTMRIKNTSDKDIILAYEAGSSFAVDDQGNRYGYGVAGSSDKGTSGIGLASDGKADPQFVLAPGESKDARFTVIRGDSKDVLGTELVYYVALEELEILPSKQIREIRQFSLTFPHIGGR